MFYSNKMSLKIVELAANNNDDVKKNTDVYVYLVNYILEQIIFLITIIIFGLFIHNVLFSILFFLVFFTYRSTGGGYHASNTVLCSILSYMAFFASYIFCFKFNISKDILSLILYIISVVFMFICPFSDCKNRRRTEEQKKSLKLKQIIFITVFSIAGLGFYYTDNFLYFKLIMVSTFIIAFAQAVGVIQMWLDKGGSYDI